MKIVSFIQHFVFVNFNLIVYLRETSCNIQMGDEVFCLVPRRLSLSMLICAQRKAGRRKRASTSLVSPSHGPLRFVTGHWRFAFASMWKNYEAPEKEEDLSPSSDLVLDRTDKNQYVVAEFYPWSKFYFLLFTKSYNHTTVFADKKVIICALCFIQFVVYSMRNPVVYRTAKKVVFC